MANSSTLYKFTANLGLIFLKEMVPFPHTSESHEGWCPLRLLASVPHDLMLYLAVYIRQAHQKCDQVVISTQVTGSQSQ